MDGPQWKHGMDSFATPEARPRACAHAALEADERRALMARALAFLFAAGAALSLLLLLTFPQPEADVNGMLSVIAATFAAAVWVTARGERIPPGAYPWLVVGGTILITAGIQYRGEPTAAHALFYLWVVFYSCYFFHPAVALGQFGLAVTGYALVLLASDEAPADALELWLVAAMTLLVAGLLIAALKFEVDRMVLRLGAAARTDPLTGLFNRRGFEETFDLELERARRGDHPLSVLIGDLDHFKQVNDHFGHHTGDRALTQASEVLALEKRRIDTVARLGGEEFALILPETGVQPALLLAERLRTAVKEAFADEQVALTVSFGVATFPEHGKSRQDLLGAADDALYAAKELGRDRTVIYNKEIIGVLTPANARNGKRNEQLATLLTLAQSLDGRDACTAEHSQTVARYCELIATELGLPQVTVERVRLAGLLHDVGNVAISNILLSKPGPLSSEEWNEIRRHSEIGARILANARLGDIGEWILAHHERVDGAGFPFGLTNGSIPLEARIVAVADAFEAMTSERPHRPALSFDEAERELRRNAGTQFDAEVVEAAMRTFDRNRVLL
jgi:diguanylate cyclase (GGDEF)-like protein/putative nucleotidyltransferase with HDIG domain